MFIRMRKESDLDKIFSYFLYKGISAKVQN